METVKGVFVPVENIKYNSKKKRVKPIFIMFLIGLLTALYLFFFCYFINTIKSIRIEGADFLADEYVLELVDVNVNDRFFTITKSLNENKVTDSIYINSCEITLNKHHELVVSIKENTIVGYTGVNSNDKLLLADGTLMNYEANVIKNIALLPYIYNVNDNLLDVLAVRLGIITPDILMHISEVTGISFTYQKNMLKLTLDDGYYAYTSYEGLPYMNYCLSMIEQDTNKEKGCIYIMESEEKAFILSCETLEGYRNDLD